MVISWCGDLMVIYLWFNSDLMVVDGDLHRFDGDFMESKWDLSNNVVSWNVNGNLTM